MKFTDGYWVVKKGIEPLYAVEYFSHQFDGQTLTVFAPGKHITDRGACLNLGMLTIRITSPLRDVIKVSVSHFEGGLEKEPHIEIRDNNPEVSVKETEDSLVFTSGSTHAIIDKRANSWKLSFEDGTKELTSTGHRNMAYMEDVRNLEHPVEYLVEQLAIDVDELIYGFGERFTPFVKNGQVIEMWNEDGGTSSEIEEYSILSDK